MKNYNLAVGIDVGGTNIRAAVVNGKEIDGKIIEEPVEKELVSFKKQLKRIITRLNLGREKMPIGLALPGLVDYKTSSVVHCPNLPFLIDLNLSKEFPGCKIGNDADMALMGELAHKDKLENILYLSLGTGIGSAFHIDGKGSWESSLLAGEIGHLKVVEGGRPCTCGTNGCVSAYASAQSILNIAKEQLDVRSAEDVFWIAGEGNPVALEIVRNAGKYLGITIANVINTLGVEQVILSGKICKSYNLFAYMLEENIKKNTYAFEKRKLNIEVSDLIDKAAIIGAAIHCKK